MWKRGCHNGVQVARPGIKLQELIVSHLLLVVFFFQTTNSQLDVCDLDNGGTVRPEDDVVV
jgi:hypothetical protein